MAYKTLLLKIYRPSRRKRAIMESAMNHYANALQFLLARYADDIQTLALGNVPVTRRQLLNLIGKETLCALNFFQVQPFKDSLKIDFANTAASFIAQRRQNSRARYPCAYVDNERCRDLVNEIIRRFDAGRIGETGFSSRLDRILGRSGHIHSLYFGRYSLNRDYCLLYDPDAKRFYAKLYLLNVAGRIYSEGVEAPRLRYVAPDFPPADEKAGLRRYIIVPLAFGRYQLKTLGRALKDPSVLHTARLVRRENDFFIVLNVETMPPRTARAATTLGLARNPWGGLDYTVCGAGGKALENGRLDAKPDDTRKLYLLAKEIVRLSLKFSSQIVVEAAGGKKDGAAYKAEGSRLLKTTEYRRLTEILSYKLPEAGMPAPAQVSAGGLAFICPVCGARTRRNRLSRDLFACVECGYVCPNDHLGSLNLARRPFRCNGML